MTHSNLMKIQDCLETDVELINKTMFGNGRNTNDKWDIVCVSVCKAVSYSIISEKTELELFVDCRNDT